MRCPHCRHDNPDDARFCNQCAHALLRQAGSGVILDRFALEGERKQVSVLFADTKGSMQLLAGLDPEDARNLLDPMLEHMMEAVHHYEGTVNQVMGDGIMALFGAPIALEDHAARACCAALRMQASVERHGEALRRAGATAPQIRVGVNSGEVVVRSIDSDLHMDYTAVGETTHLAARMEQLASAGSILITAETLRLAQASIQVKPLGPMPIAGLREAVNVYELVAAGPARSPVHGAPSRGLTRFVGRGGELAVLADALDLAGRGHGQVVTIVGAAGIGKSRLLREFVHGSHTHGWLVLETGCVAFGKANGYRPVIEALKIHFAITEQDDPARVRERVRAKLLALGVSLEPGLSALWALLDVLPADSPWPRLDPGQRQRLIVHSIKELLLSECQVQPVVMVFEDLQWADSESLAVLDALVEALPGANLLLLASRRPDSERTWRRATRELGVDALPRTAAEELLDVLLGDASELHDLRRQLLERTEGNPFFIEECVSALRETGVLAGTPGACRLGPAAAALKVPPTVQAILAARIDRLAPDDKRLLQAAAVVGHSVAFALLQSVAALPADALQQALARLQTAGFLCRSTPVADPACTYTFKHALTHEVAYASPLAARRRTPPRAARARCRRDRRRPSRAHRRACRAARAPRAVRRTEGKGDPVLAGRRHQSSPALCAFRSRGPVRASPGHDRRPARNARSAVGRVGAAHWARPRAQSEQGRLG